MAKSKKENKILLISLFFVSSVIFLSLVSWNSSPLFEFLGYDSPIFKTMGKFMADGLTPYKDCFDHKGPIIVLVEWIGYGIAKSDYTLILLQAIFLTAALYGVFKIARLFLNKNKSILLTIATLLVCCLFMLGQGGNMVEEWILPFIVWSTYFAVRFFAYKESEHNYKCSILYGITIAFAAFSRLTDAIPVVVLVIVILIFLLKQKAWENIFKNILMILVGMLIITVPIIIWFIANGAFKEMIYATFVYNYKYMIVKSFVPNAVLILKHIARYMLPPIFAVVLQIAMIVKKKDVWLNVLLLAQTIVAIVMQLTSALFPHYLYIWVPTIIVTLIVAVKDYGIMKMFVRGYVALLLVVCIGTSVLAFNKYFKSLRESTIAYKEKCKDINLHIPDKRKKFVAVNCSPYIYLVTDTTPCYRLYHNQDMHSLYDQKTKDEWKKMASSSKADYMVIDKTSYCPSYNILKKNYKMIYANDQFAIIEKK